MQQVLEIRVLSLFSIMEPTDQLSDAHKVSRLLDIDFYFTGALQ